MRKGREALFINRKLSADQALIILASLIAVKMPDDHGSVIQRDLFVELSKSYERRWPESYQIAVTVHALPHWRDYIVDNMTDGERRAAVLKAVR